MMNVLGSFTQTQAEKEGKAANSLSLLKLLLFLFSPSQTGRKRLKDGQKELKKKKQGDWAVMQTSPRMRQKK